MYAITKYTDTFNGGVGTAVSMWSDKDQALDVFASLVQEELFFLDEEMGFTDFIETYSKTGYSFSVKTITVGFKSLQIGTYPEGMITVEYFDGDTDTYRFQMVECTNGLSLSL